MRVADIPFVTMTILPGQPIAAPDAPPPAPPNAPRGPRVGLGGRTLAAVVAAVVAAGGGGAWFLLHSTGGTTPAAAVVHHANPVHHKAKPSTAPAPRTKAEAMRAATKIFAVLPAQLPGWRVDGKATFDTGGGSEDPVSQSIDRCFTSLGRGIGVNSPSYDDTTGAPTHLGVDVMLAFMRSPARAAADLAALRQPRLQQCLRARIVGKTVSIDRGATLRFTSMRSVPAPHGAVTLEFDGQIDSNVIGHQPVRVVMLADVDRATEILVTSTGLGAALPVSTDVRVLKAVVAQTRRVIG